jgi:apolipoprotein N-acyltransferase
MFDFLPTVDKEPFMIASLFHKKLIMKHPSTSTQDSTRVQDPAQAQVLPTSKTFYFGLLLIAIASGTLASAKWGIAIFAWISPLCLLYFFRLANVKRRLLWFLPTLIIISVASSVDVAPFPALVLIVMGIIESLKALIIFLVDRWITKKNNHFLATLFFPAAYVTMEFLNTKMGGGVWWSVANSQFSFSWLVQLSSVTGLWGISFIIYWFASVTVWALKSYFSGTQYKKGLAIYGAVLTIVLLFGAIRYNTNPFEKSKLVRVSGLSVPMFSFLENIYKDFCGKDVTINPRLSITSPELQAITSAEIPFIETADSVKFKRGYDAMHSTNDSLFALSQLAADNGAKIIVWSEANALAFTFEDARLTERGRAFAEKNKVYLLMAAAIIQNGKITPGKKFIINKATLIGPDGKILNEFHKNNPVPMAEASVPGDGIIPVIETPYGNISTSICYDADFPAQMRQLGKNKTDILLLPSGDWSAISPYHTYMAAFRGIENGNFVLRQASGGLSAVTDYRGKMLNSFDFYKPGKKFWIADIPIGRVPTIYTKIGDAFAYTCIAVSSSVLIYLLFILVAGRVNRRQHRKTTLANSMA